jgi:UDP-N-acetylmuramate--alanine ligase
MTARFAPGQHIHFVGIGGIGLSAIARVLLERGCKISGSDRAANALTDALARDGAIITQGHRAENLTTPDMVIISSAIHGNPEVEAAQARGIPVYKRKDIIADLMRDRYVIAVAGTAGKTTTTAMIVHILRENGLDPGYIVGGVMANTGTNGANGSGDLFVIEADEYDNMFHGLRPNTIVLTNVDYDHPDFFPTHDAMIDSFRIFLRRMEQRQMEQRQMAQPGVLIASADDPTARDLAREMRHAGIYAGTYGFRDTANYTIQNLQLYGEGVRFDIGSGWDEHGVYDEPHIDYQGVVLPLPGDHNAQNALAAMLAAMNRGVPFSHSARALATFQGTGRRFEVLDDTDGIALIDDYAHHPAKIRATLQAARARYADRAIWAVWQPHTYSRTEALIDDFAAAFGNADYVLVTEIYAAREQAGPGTITGAQTAARLAHPRVTFMPTFQAAADHLVANVQAPAAIVLMSAGDADQIGLDYLRRRRHTDG